jgi:hypothetical protein
MLLASAVHANADRQFDQSPASVLGKHTALATWDGAVQVPDNLPREQSLAIDFTAAGLGQFVEVGHDPWILVGKQPGLNVVL